MLVFEWNFLGLSSETKPLNNEKVINGSTFYECDTSNFFIYYNGEWYKQTFVTEDGINVYLYKLLMRKMFKNAFDTNISKAHIYNPEISSNISFTTVLPSNITEMEMYGDSTQDGTPTPDTPVPIQTVTGEQTVTINGEQIYTIDLGTTELCKLGDYQDYIYKSGDDWYVHKAIGKMTYTGDSSENWDYSGTSNGPFRINIPNSKYHTSNDVAPLVYCDYYTPIKWTEISSTTYAVTAFNNNVLPFRNRDINSLAAWKAWLGSHNMTVYYPFATPTDTKITDTELITSLNSILSYTFPIGLNSIIVSASELPALLKLTIIEKE